VIAVMDKALPLEKRINAKTAMEKKS